VGPQLRLVPCAGTRPRIFTRCRPGQLMSPPPSSLRARSANTSGRRVDGDGS
jgi:hypothetical protein